MKKTKVANDHDVKYGVSASPEYYMHFTIEKDERTKWQKAKQAFYNLIPILLLGALQGAAIWLFVWGIARTFKAVFDGAI